MPTVKAEIDLIMKIPLDYWPDFLSLLVQGPVNKEGLHDYEVTWLKDILTREPDPPAPQRIYDPFTGRIISLSAPYKIEESG
jgi:hypothetical protein